MDAEDLIKGPNGEFFIMTNGEGRVAKEICAELNEQYKAGNVFYALGSKREKISAKKVVLLVSADRTRVEDARSLASIPENGVSVHELRALKGTIFVQSTSAARKLSGLVLVRVSGGEKRAKLERPTPAQFFAENRIGGGGGPVGPFPRDVWRLIAAQVGHIPLDAEEPAASAVQCARLLTNLASSCRLLYHVVASELDGVWRLIVASLYEEPEMAESMRLTTVETHSFADPNVCTWKQQALLRIQSKKIPDVQRWTEPGEYVCCGT